MIIKDKNKKEYYGKIININDDVSIFADRNLYIVKYGKHRCYFRTLEECFNDIFEERIKVKLIENQRKDMDGIIEVIGDTKRWLESIFKKIETPSF